MSGGLPSTVRFPIRFGGLNHVFMWLLGAGRHNSYIDVADDTVTVRMGIGFRATIHRRSIVEAAHRPGYIWWAYGVHTAGQKRWIVNGSGHSIVRFRMDPLGRGRVLGVPTRLREVWVSLEDPDGFLAAIAR